MIDSDILLSKAASIRKHLNRVAEKMPADLEHFSGDLDAQDIVLFNLQMAIQSCIDMGTHIVSDEGLGVAGSTNEVFYMLEENGYIDVDLTEKMISAVGFRNLMVYEYDRLNVKRVFEIARKDMQDLDRFMKAILTKANMELE